MPDRILLHAFGPMGLKQLRACVLFLPAMALALCASAGGQMTGGPNPLSDASSVSLPDAPLPQTVDLGQAGDKDRVTLTNTPVHILRDQAAIWTSPARVREHDFVYLLPLALATTGAITADHQVMSSSKLNDKSLNNHADTASKGLLGGFVVAPVILYGLGGIHHNAHATETGILAGEAMVDSLVVDEVLKVATMRERPTVDGAKGKFFQTSVGRDSSFPSTHSIVAWSSAAVIASEYPGPITQITAYGLATGLSLTRVLGRQHFPSDVLVGSAVGWLVGRYVYHKHHRAVED